MLDDASISIRAGALSHRHALAGIHGVGRASKEVAASARRHDIFSSLALRADARISALGASTRDEFGVSIFNISARIYRARRAAFMPPASYYFAA